MLPNEPSRRILKGIKVHQPKGASIMKLHVVLEPSEEGGYTAHVPALPGCISEGNTREEALANIKEAIQLYIEPVDDDIEHAPNAEVIEIAV
jgi:predicted RNase H-like HicB family nuclease